MKVAEYDEIHSDRNRYSIHVHELADGEYVVEVRALFDVVSKDGHSSEND
jgi:predicted RNase H-like HicB family nuclease